MEELLTLLTCWAITELSIAMAKWMDGWLDWETKPIIRAVLQTIFLLIGTYFLLKIFDYLALILCQRPKGFSDELGNWQCAFTGLLMSILISAFHTGNFFFKSWKSSMLEATELQLKAAKFKEIAMQAQLQSLKLQLDPHFLFNNFSILSALIDEEPETASSFLENLSKVYRYMINNLDNNVIAIEEELKFIDSYNYLIKIRYGENVNVDVQVSNETKLKVIPPITIQLLIENAIKHNIATGENPLQIKIYDDQSYLIVENTLQPIDHIIPTTKLGLENIKSRYKLLFDKDVLIKKIDGKFCVALELLQPK
ncbi:sensor histidine kinase [Chryseobacterium artocarpi]|nr:histidine kinase [Chryseobacterium artocarpi]